MHFHIKARSTHSGTVASVRDKVAKLPLNLICEALYQRR